MVSLSTKEQFHLTATFQLIRPFQIEMTKSLYKSSSVIVIINSQEVYRFSWSLCSSDFEDFEFLSMLRCCIQKDVHSQRHVWFSCYRNRPFKGYNQLYKSTLILALLMKCSSFKTLGFM